MYQYGRVLIINKYENKKHSLDRNGRFFIHQMSDLTFGLQDKN